MEGPREGLLGAVPSELGVQGLSSAARFHPTEVSAIYSRYKRHGDDTMDESFFPILWTADGYRTPFLDDR